MISKSLIQQRWLKLRHLAKGVTNLSARSCSTHERRDDNPKVIKEYLNDNVFRFTLNNIKTLNSLDMDMIHLLWEQLTEWHKNPSKVPRVVFMRGAGEKAFCAGGDIKSIYDGGVNEINPNVPKEFFAREYIVDYALTQMKPVQISVWNGIVMGGGVGVSVHSPIRIATEKTVFAMPETRIGFFTDVGGSYFLSRLKDNINLGIYLGVTGHRLKAKDCLKWGVATNYMETNKLEDLYKTMTENARPDSSFEEIKEIVDSYSDNNVDGEPIPEDIINHCFQPDNIRNITQRLADIADDKVKGYDKEFSKKWLSQISEASPISCAVVVEQIKRGKNMTLEEVFEMEYGISQGFMEYGEFYEGVRALLIDKDQKPKWKHRVITDVTDDDLAFFFDRPEKLDLDLSKLYADGIKF